MTQTSSAIEYRWLSANRTRRVLHYRLRLAKGCAVSLFVSRMPADGDLLRPTWRIASRCAVYAVIKIAMIGSRWCRRIPLEKHFSELTSRCVGAGSRRNSNRLDRAGIRRGKTADKITHQLRRRTLRVMMMALLTRPDSLIAAAS